MDVLTGGLVHELAAAAPVEATAVHYAAIVRELGALRRHTIRAAPGSSEIIPEFPLRGFLVDEDDN